MSLLNHLYAEKTGVVLVDLSQIALSTAMFTYKGGEKLDVKELRQLVLATLKFNVLKFKNQGYERFVICIDNAKHGYWRKQEAAYYKGNRAIEREDKKDSFDWDGYFSSIAIVIQELKDFMPYYVIDVRHAEADDSIAILSKWYLANGWKVMICSSDGDFTQLHESEDIKQWSPVQRKEVEVKTGSPAEDCLTKIIKGDKKDCVATIKVRGDFYLSKNEGQRVPSTSAEFITQMVGKTDAELITLFRDDVQLTYSKQDKTKKSGNTKGLEYLKKSLVDDYGVDADKADAIMTRYDVDGTIDILAKLRMKRFEENRLLIDFNYIREDIKEAILKAHDEFVPNPRGKIYTYFIKHGLVKLLPDINLF